ncbi:hypothetical protein PVAND_001664 [Polypedilum vanderplanki]|uniref:Palmitoyltransferase n=1 Tax=Polypedilum vanderplanki TaxID=319348 RepID=A0A9J6BP37_POLVA|nr:hypothetical protein PVAND_001664 [Polypedilum vanderplanki]
MKLLSESKIKKNKFDVLLPLIFILATNFIAIVSLEFCIMIFLVFPVAITSFYIYCAKKSSRTNVFFIFSLLSAIYFICLFEFFVPLLELLPQENFVFVSLITLTVIFFFKTYQHSSLNRLGASSSTTSESLKNNTNDSVSVSLIEAEEKQCDSDEDLDSEDKNSCSICRKFIPARTFHCNSCKSCIIGRDHHNYFLNCCIGRFNHKYFLFGCISSFSALLLFANLSLTSICHPFPVFKIFGVMFLLPDDCTDVFRETEIALCFVGAIYAIELAIALFIVIIHQFVLISKGMTSHEFWIHKERVNSRKYGIWRNWKNFCYI